MADNIDDLLLEKNLKKKIYSEISSSKTTINSNIKKDFEDLSKQELFSKKSVWKVFNRITKTSTLINGIQADSLIAHREDTRKNLVNHCTDCFLAEHHFVEFFSFES